MGADKRLAGRARHPGPAAAQPGQPEYLTLFAGDIWQDHLPNPFSWVNSLLIHGLVLSALFLPLWLKPMLTSPTGPKLMDVTNLHLILPWLPGQDETKGGGGGGERSPLPASHGAIPKFSAIPLAPPTAKIPNLQPILPVQASLLGPPDLILPQMSPRLPWGDPTGVWGPLSSGPGTDGGIGTGRRGGVGSGDGPGYDAGKNGGYGGGVFIPGIGGVSAPVPTYRPDPAYSEEARKAKLQGNVSLWIVVDRQGSVADIRVANQLGMGLDEKAVEAVRTWRFRPGMRQGIPVPVRVLVEVSFRLF